MLLRVKIFFLIGMIGWNFIWGEVFVFLNMVWEVNYCNGVFVKKYVIKCIFIRVENVEVLIIIYLMK